MTTVKHVQTLGKMNGPVGVETFGTINPCMNLNRQGRHLSNMLSLNEADLKLVLIAQNVNNIKFFSEIRTGWN